MDKALAVYWKKNSASYLLKEDLKNDYDFSTSI